LSCNCDESLLRFVKHLEIERSEIYRHDESEGFVRCNPRTPDRIASHTNRIATQFVLSRKRSFLDFVIFRNLRSKFLNRDEGIYALVQSQNSFSNFAPRDCSAFRLWVGDDRDGWGRGIAKQFRNRTNPNEARVSACRGICGANSERRPIDRREISLNC